MLLLPVGRICEKECLTFLLAIINMRLSNLPDPSFIRRVGSQVVDKVGRAEV